MSSAQGGRDRDRNIENQMGIVHALIPFRLGLLAVAMLGASAAPPALAQVAVVQKLPPPAISDLNNALGRLARNSRDVEALVAAGDASLTLGDFDAAIGFFSRASELSPTNSRAKAGLGAAFVRSENPYDALLMFEEAEKYGALPSMLAGDRGLALDLVGGNEQAQYYYRQALTGGADDEVSRRLALSLAIAGDQRGAEAVLAPLVRRRDPAASRMRAFTLAIAGKADSAVELAEKSMPAALAKRITPYLRYMPNLTPAQQAAAANFGHFPPTSNIGKDDPRIAQYAKKAGVSQVARGSDNALVPSGKPLGRKLSQREKRQAEKQRTQEEAALAKAAAAQKQADLQKAAQKREAERLEAQKQAVQKQAASQLVARQRVEAARQAKLASARQASLAAATAPPQSAAPIAKPSVSIATGASVGTDQAETAIASFDLAEVPGAQMAAPANVLAGPSVAAPISPSPIPVPATAPASVAEAFADFSLPSAPARPAAGAVDITTITPPREELPKLVAKTPEKPAAKPAKSAPPAHPARVWVQVATGRDTNALAFDWRRISRKAQNLLKTRKAYLAPWGQTNRLLTGPFDNIRAAQKFVTELKAVEVDSFTFTSAEGQDIGLLGAAK